VQLCWESDISILALRFGSTLPISIATLIERHLYKLAQKRERTWRLLGVLLVQTHLDRLSRIRQR
jgi:hypothetical protein